MKKYQKIVLWALAIFATVAFAWFLQSCISNNPIADDYSYFADINRDGVLGFLKYHYTEHSGRFGQALLFALGWVLSGIASVKVMPFLLLLILGGAMSWLIYRLAPMQKKTWGSSIVLGFATTAVIVLTMVSFYDSVLWWTASSIYLSSLIVVVLDIVFVHKILTDKRVVPWQYTLMLLFMVFGQGFSEITSITLTAAAGVLGVYLIARKKYTQLKRLIPVGLVLGAGFLLVYLSGGSSGRRSGDGVGDGIDWWNLLCVMPAWFMKIFKNNWTWWQFCSLVALGGGVSTLIKSISAKRALMVTGLTAGIGGVSLYAILLINSYVGWMDLRSFTAFCFVVGIMVIVVAAVWAKVIWEKSTLTWLALIVVAVLVAMPGIVYDGSVRMKGQAIRDYFYDLRADSIRDQLNSGAETLELYSLPVVSRERVGASDIWDKTEQSSWTTGAFRSFYQIPQEVEILQIETPYQVIENPSY